MRNTWWSQRTDCDTVCRRARGRAKHNAWRKYLATMRRKQVVDLLLRYGFKYGVGALIAAELRVHKSTVSRDIKTLFPLMRTCAHGHQMMPRRWWAEAALATTSFTLVGSELDLVWETLP